MLPPNTSSTDSPPLTPNNIPHSAILDSGCSHHFLQSSAPSTTTQPDTTIQVQLPDGSNITSSHSTTIQLHPTLSTEAQHAFVLPEMHSPFHQRYSLHSIQRQHHHCWTPIPNHQTLAHRTTHTNHRRNTLHQQRFSTELHHKGTHCILPRLQFLPRSLHLVPSNRCRPFHHMAGTHLPTSPAICPHIHSDA